MVNYGYEKGYKAIREQIYPSLLKTQPEPDLSHYTFDLLNRTAPGWMKA